MLWIWKKLILRLSRRARERADQAAANELTKQRFRDAVRVETYILGRINEAGEQIFAAQRMAKQAHREAAFAGLYAHWHVFAATLAELFPEVKFHPEVDKAFQKAESAFARHARAALSPRFSDLEQMLRRQVQIKALSETLIETAANALAQHALRAGSLLARGARENRGDKTWPDYFEARFTQHARSIARQDRVVNMLSVIAQYTDQCGHHTRWCDTAAEYAFTSGSASSETVMESRLATVRRWRDQCLSAAENARKAANMAILAAQRAPTIGREEARAYVVGQRKTSSSAS